MKKGISLIVLVITIIVMIILAASVVITLSNTGVINRASEAVNLTNEAAVQDLAALIWADAYMDGKRGTELEAEVTTKLSEQGVTATDWNITVTDTGVTIKEKYKGPTLGSLITSDNYGDTVDYSVTVNGITYSDWQIYYHNNEYVYLAMVEGISVSGLSDAITAASLTSEEMALYNKFRVGNWTKYTLRDEVVLEGGTETYQAYNSQATVWLIRNYSNFANKSDYGSYVEGAIGSPTVELLASGWNGKNYTPIMTLGVKNTGYIINENNTFEVTESNIYVPDYSYFLASPSSDSEGAMFVIGNTWISTCGYNTPLNVRPVVCLKASIPATVGTTTDFSLVK